MEAVTALRCLRVGGCGDSSNAYKMRLLKLLVIEPDMEEDMQSNGQCLRTWLPPLRK